MILLGIFLELAYHIRYTVMKFAGIPQGIIGGIGNIAGADDLGIFLRAK